MKTQNIRLIAILITIGVLLLIPFIAMQFTSEVTWGVMDFCVAGGLLLMTGLAIELVLRKVTSFQYRVAICLAILAVFALVWIELAVGIFDSPIGGN